MEIRPHRIIKRKITKEIKVGKLTVGGKAPISVQSMTNTLTTDVKETINQIHDLEEAGVDIVRVSCPDEKSTKALKEMGLDGQPNWFTALKNTVPVPALVQSTWTLSPQS